MLSGKGFAVMWMLLLLSLCGAAQLGVTTEGAVDSTAASPAEADSSQVFTIRDISISGARHTRPATIFRELSFQVNEAYPLGVIVEKFAETRKQLMNTGLFRNVVVSLRSMQGYDVYVQIEVEERWYIYPIPFIRTVDNTFQRWWTDGGRRMDRINYGIKVSHKNFMGRNDRLHVYLMNGYTKQVALRYDNLYLDRAMKWSATLGVSGGKNRELNYMTVGNKLVPLKQPDHYVHSFFHSFAEVSYRRAIKTRHTFGLSYHYDDVADTVFQLNPHFATAPRPISYPELSYTLSYLDLDFNPYPTRGYAANLSLRKKGLGGQVNTWELTAMGAGTWPIGSRFFFNLRTAGLLKLPLRQPYIGQQFLGHNDMFLQGYENYFIDGVAGGYVKAIIARPLFRHTFHVRSKRFPQVNDLPVRVYGKVFGNAGYSYNPQPGDNRLTNKMLYSGGFGLDIIAFTDFVIKLEWSFNALGQNGLYLHRKDYF